jgi:hypothetical protein
MNPSSSSVLDIADEPSLILNVSSLLRREKDVQGIVILKANGLVPKKDVLEE